MKRFLKDKGKGPNVPYLVYSFFIVLVIIVSQMALFFIDNYEFVEYSKENINNVIKHEGVNLKLICLSTSCEYIEYDGSIYHHDTHKLAYLKKGSLNKEIADKYVKIALPKHSLNIYIIEHKFYRLLCIECGIITVILIMLFTLFMIFYLRTKSSILFTNKLELFIDKFKLESKLQNVITESAHHEMLTPISGINTGFKEIDKYVAELYDIIRHIKKEHLNVYNNKNCTIMERIIKANETIEDYNRYKNIVMSSAERLELVLFQMSNTKYVKRSNKDIDLYTLIKTTVDTLQIYHITSNFNCVIHNKDVLKTLTIDIIDKPTFMNILNNQIKNALEANATKLIIECKKSKSLNKINLIITDNGSGITSIKDKHDLNKIFKLGYSSKDGNDKNSAHKELSMVDKIMKWLNNYPSDRQDIIEERESYRGIGLFVSKGILDSIGGTIKILNTSYLGTSFLITIPTKPYKKDTSK